VVVIRDRRLPTPNRADQRRIAQVPQCPHHTVLWIEPLDRLGDREIQLHRALGRDLARFCDKGGIVVELRQQHRRRPPFVGRDGRAVVMLPRRGERLRDEEQDCADVAPRRRMSAQVRAQGVELRKAEHAQRLPPFVIGVEVQQDLEDVVMAPVVRGVLEGIDVCFERAAG
jgi:hypothetical protein